MDDGMPEPEFGHEFLQLLYQLNDVVLATGEPCEGSLFYAQNALAPGVQPSPRSDPIRRKSLLLEDLPTDRRVLLLDCDLFITSDAPDVFEVTPPWLTPACFGFEPYVDDGELPAPPAQRMRERSEQGRIILVRRRDDADARRPIKHVEIAVRP